MCGQSSGPPPSLGQLLLLLFRSRIPNFDSALKFKILPGDELKFRIHVRVNSMKQPKLALHKLNRNIMRRCSHPQRHTVHQAIRFPDAQVMPLRHNESRSGNEYE